MWVLLTALLPPPEGDLITMTDVVFKPRGQLISSVWGPSHLSCGGSPLALTDTNLDGTQNFSTAVYPST